MVCVPYEVRKRAWSELFSFSSFDGPIISSLSHYTETTMNKSAELRIGTKFKMRDGAKGRVRKEAKWFLESNVSINMIACHQCIEIDDGYLFIPNVQIYDYDLRDIEEIGAMRYKSYSEK